MEVAFPGRFGNNLFQYVCARLFAEDNGLQLVTSFNHAHVVKPSPEAVGEMVSGDFVELNDFSGDIIGRKWPRARYLLNGFFQKASWYHPRRERIMSFMSPAPTPKVVSKDIVMHVRLGDYLRGRMIHPRWYLDILSSEKFRRLHIVMEKREECYLRHFAQYDPNVVCGEMAHDWNFIRKFDRIICSNSTFAWWAAFMGSASKVYVFNRWGANPHYDLASVPWWIHRDGPFLEEEPFDWEA